MRRAVVGVSRPHRHDHTGLALHRERAPLDLVVDGRLDAECTQLRLRDLGLARGFKRRHRYRFGVLIYIAHLTED